jgi:hypothetical protein
MVLNDGSYAKFWVYPQDNNNYDHVNSIYNSTAAGSFVEVGYDWQWWMLLQPQVFVHSEDAAGNFYELFFPAYYLPILANTRFKLQRIAGSPYSWQALVNEAVIWDFGNVGISSSYADAGAEAASTYENNFASWTYIACRKWVSNSGTGSWYYWPNAYERWDRVSRSPTYRLNPSNLGAANHWLFVEARY